MSTETDVDTALLESLDFAIPCESPSHGEPEHVIEMHGRLVITGHLGGDAEWIIENTCPNCNDTISGFVCEGRRISWLKRATANTVCSACGKSAPTADFNFTFTPIGNAR